ncbi:MAG: hypothetical protein H5U05_10240 [Candidatus Aminicenantes bacterium]|nr:hypothetical protein [Candidatus Aminicenantes bacterium]
MGKRPLSFRHPRIIFFPLIFLSLISPFTIPPELAGQSKLEQQKTSINWSPPSDIAIPFVDDLGLLVYCPPGWTPLYPDSSRGTIPLFICPPGSVQPTEMGYSFKNGLIVDIRKLPSYQNLIELVKAEQKEISKTLPSIKFGPEETITSYRNYKFLTTTAEDKIAKFKMKIGFSKIGDKVIIIQLISQADFYQENLDQFFYVLHSLLPLKITVDQDIVSPQPAPLLLPAEAHWRKKLLGDGRYEYWKNYEAGTQAKFKVSQKFSSFSLQSEKTFRVLNVNEEAAIITCQEKITGAPGHPSGGTSEDTTENIIAFSQAEEAFPEKDLFDTRLGVDLSYFLSHPDAIVVAEDTENLPIQGRTLGCERVVILINSKEQPKRLSIWHSEAVPGGLVKFALESLDKSGLYQEAQLISYTIKKREATGPTAATTSQEQIKEMPAIFYVKQRLPIFWRGTSPFEYFTDLSYILYIFTIYYLGVNSNPEETLGRIQPIIDELEKARQDFNNFLSGAHEELEPAELTKLNFFIDASESYLRLLNRLNELLIQTIRLSKTQNKEDLEKLKSNFKSLSTSFTENQRLLDHLQNLTKSLSAITLKVKR